MNGKQDQSTTGVKSENLSPTVTLSRYIIDQKTGSPYEVTDYAESTISVEFLMIAPGNVRSTKHENFLKDLREFLSERNGSKT